MTYLQLVNATLRRLRRAEVSSVSATAYSALIGDLVNQAKREVEDAWWWLELMTTTSIAVSSGTDTYTLTGYGKRFAIRQVHDTTRQGTVRAIRQEDFRRFFDFPGGTTGLPSYWRISGYSSGDPQIQFWPDPDQSVTVKVYAKVAQADLSADGTSLSVPDQPVLAGAYLRALDERGEDGGTTFIRAQTDFQQALGDAIAQDDWNRAQGHESDWRVA